MGEKRVPFVASVFCAGEIREAAAYFGCVHVVSRRNEGVVFAWHELSPQDKRLASCRARLLHLSCDAWLSR